MNVLDSVRVIVYRCHEKGLEVLMIKNQLHSDEAIWSLPKAKDDLTNYMDSIELEKSTDENGQAMRIYALEADWHQIPSIREIIKHDVKRLKSKIKKVVNPQLEDFTFIQVKDALKQALPNEYEALKELKDIIIAKNQLSSL